MHLKSLSLFQAKLITYRDNAVEGGDLVEQLTSQAKTDQQDIRDLQDKVETGKQELLTTKVKYCFFSFTRAR